MQTPPTKGLATDNKFSCAHLKQAVGGSRRLAYRPSNVVLATVLLPGSIAVAVVGAVLWALRVRR
jgi:hypothetical protein